MCGWSWKPLAIATSATRPGARTEQAAGTFEAEDSRHGFRDDAELGQKALAEMTSAEADIARKLGALAPVRD